MFSDITSSTQRIWKVEFYLREFRIANKFFNFLSLRYDNDMALSDDFKEIYYDELLKVWEASFLLVLQSVISFLSSDYYLPAYSFFVEGDDKKIMHWSGNDNTNISEYKKLKLTQVMLK